jgi:hypothetical protein
MGGGMQGFQHTRHEGDFVAGRLRGFRRFRFRLGSSNEFPYRLASPSFYDGQAIGTGDRLAVCRGWLDTVDKHPAPQESCYCGWYAWYTPENVNNFGSGNDAVDAVVEASGRVVMADKGFRAQKIRIVALTTPGIVHMNLDQIMAMEVRKARANIAQLRRRLRERRIENAVDQYGEYLHQHGEVHWRVKAALAADPVHEENIQLTDEQIRGCFSRAQDIFLSRQTAWNELEEQFDGQARFFETSEAMYAAFPPQYPKELIGERPRIPSVEDLERVRVFLDLYQESWKRASDGLINDVSAGYKTWEADQEKPKFNLNIDSLRQLLDRIQNSSRKRQP